MARDCPNPQASSNGGDWSSDSRPPRTCHKCNQTGHIARDCTSDAAQNSGGGGSDDWDAPISGSDATRPSGTDVCYNCRQPGHRSAECDKPREASKCRKCHKADHATSECPEPHWLDENGNERPPPSDYRPNALTEDQLDDKFFGLTVIPAGENFDSHLNEAVSCTGYENEAEKPGPMKDFTEKISSETILGAIKKSNYKVPTLIQQYAIPVILDGRDVMACAQTGSGKTVAFLAPILQKLFEASAAGTLDSGYGQQCQTPIALVVTPTRELADQIHTEAFKFTAGSVVKTCVVYGGTSTNYLVNQMNKGCHLLVATIGRLHDFAERLRRVSFEKLKYFVLDEADRMIDDGFMPEIRRLITRSDFPAAGSRQTVMFSATFAEQVQREAKEILASNYIFISVGKIGGVNTDVSQEVFEVESRGKKDRLMEILQSYSGGDCNRIIVFVQTKKTADFLATYLCSSGLKATSIHGDRFQKQREEALNDFKTGRMSILVATSVAARGLDIKDIRLVVNYDLPDSIDDYVHRIGRTGRVGNVGKAISFFDPQHNSGIAEDLARALRDSNQEVPPFLLHSAGAADIDGLAGDDFGAPNIDVRFSAADDLLGSIAPVPAAPLAVPEASSTAAPIEVEESWS